MAPVGGRLVFGGAHDVTCVSVRSVFFFLCTRGVCLYVFMCVMVCCWARFHPRCVCGLSCACRRVIFVCWKYIGK